MKTIFTFLFVCLDKPTYIYKKKKSLNLVRIVIILPQKHLKPAGLCWGAGGHTAASCLPAQGGGTVHQLCSSLRCVVFHLLWLTPGTVWLLAYWVGTFDSPLNQWNKKPIDQEQHSQALAFVSDFICNCERLFKRQAAFRIKKLLSSSVWSDVTNTR